MNASTSQQFVATVSGDSTDAGVNWTASCGSSFCGTFSASNPVASGTTVTYDAPGTVPTGGTATLTATSVADSQKSASVTVTITPAPLLSDGTYVFHLSGTDYSSANGSSPYFVAGAFTVTAGAITGGEQDFVDYDDSLNDQIFPGTSTISTTADGNLQIVLDTHDSSLGVGGIETLNASVVSSKRALIGEFDASATGTGTLDLQTSQTAPSGGYAFFTTGIDNSRNQLALGGVVNVDGAGSISGAGSVFDLNDAFATGVQQDQGLSQSTVTGPSGNPSPDSYGRIRFTLNPSNTQISQILLVGYVVSSGTIQLVEPVDSFGGTTGGIALSQGANTGLFTGANVGGNTYVIGAEGIDTNGPLQLIAALSLTSGDNTVGGAAALNDQANQLSGSITGGNYSVDPTGRVSLTQVNGQTFQSANLELYLDGQGNAVAISMDSSDVVAGQGYEQVAGAQLNGSYSLSANGITPMNPDSNNSVRRTASSHPRPERTADVNTPWNVVGAASVSDDNLSGFDDLNILNGSVTADVSLSGTVSGSGAVLSGNLTGIYAANSQISQQIIYFVIDDHQALGLNFEYSQLGLLYLEQVASSN